MKILFCALIGLCVLTGCDAPGAGTATGNSEDSTTIQNNTSSSQTMTPDTAGQRDKTIIGKDSDYTNNSDTPGYPAKKK